MKKKVINFIVAMALLGNITVYADMSFTDVNKNDWYYDSVMYASEKGIINGVGNNKFNPQGILTVAEAIKLSASIHANYNNYDGLKPSATSTHWADTYFDYAIKNGIIKETDFLKSDFDNAITRDRMFYIFANTLPDTEYQEINEMQNAPEQPSSEYTRKLFCAGIVIGNEKGFEEDKNITRAETAAIIHRVANLDARVKAAPKQETQTVAPQEPAPVTPQQPGQTSYELRYLNIPHTRWNGDSSVSGNFSIQGQNGYINTKFGNHSYGCANQQEYDAVMKAVEEAYQYAIKKESTNTYTNRVNKGIEDVYGRETDRTYIFLKDRVGLGTKDRVISWRVTQSIVGYMDSYLKDNYAAKSGVPHVTDGKDNNVYKYLFGSGQLDCDGSANLYMLCYDYLGFSTRTIGSYNVSHQVVEVYVNGHWILINQDTGGIDDITHAELMQMISSGSDCGIKTGSKDMIVLTAKNGKGSQLSDLAVDNTPTHNPSDTSIR